MNKTFKTVTFGGFDKKAVQSYISEQMSSFQKQVDEKENTIHTCQDQINQLNLTIQDLRQQCDQKDELLKKQQEETQQFKNTLLLKEDKIESLELQLSKMEDYVKQVQQQTRTILEESDKKCTLKLQQMEKENEEKIEAARLNAIALFDKIDEDYQKKRKNYAELCDAVHRLNLIIDKADEEANRQISTLPSSLLNKD